MLSCVPMRRERAPSVLAGALLSSAMVVCLAVVATRAQLRFRASVELVELDVVVTGKNGQIIGGLSKEDFSVTEDSRLQDIAGAQFVSIPPAHRAVTQATVPTVDVVGNSHPPLGRQWVLVIDDLHIIETHIVQTRKVVEAFLGSVSSADQVAIVFVGRSDLSQDFTSDIDLQMRAVNRIRGALGFAPDAGDDVEQRSRHRYALATVDVLKNVCSSLARSPFARKAVVYVSEGLSYSWDQAMSSGYLDMSRDPFDAQDVLQQLVSSFDIARRAGVPIYTIDPRGIPDCTAVRRGCEFQTILPIIHKQQGVLRTIAENTGGLALVNRSSTVAAVAEIVADNSSFYLLSYYPEPFVRDGRYHDVNVAVIGHPEYHVRAKRGYEAPSTDSAGGAEPKHALDGALGSALPTSAIELRGVAAPIAPGAHGMSTAVTVEVKYPVPPDGSKIDDELQFALVALDHDGSIKASNRRTFRFTATPKGTADVTYVINDVLDLPSQALVLRAGVASRSLGKVGTIHLPIEVINPRNDRLQISAVVLGFVGGTRQAALGEAAIQALLPFQPTTNRTFTASDTLRVYAPLTWASRETTVETTLTVRRGDRAVKTQHVRLDGLAGLDAHRVAAVDASVAIAGLSPDVYTFEVLARLASGQIARRVVEFTVK